MRTLVAGWVGSTNLGDELALAGLRTLLDGPDDRIAAISTDPARTRRDHGIGAVDHLDAYGIVQATRQADAVVFGGGGIVQDVTSPLNLPYHLSRVRLARTLGTPVAGVGLGIGGLDTSLGRALVRRELSGLVATSVRDLASQQLLAEVGRPGATVAADLAFALSPPARTDSPGGRLVVSLRPWSTARRRLPVAASSDPTPPAQIAALAAALDATADASELAVHFVALQTDRDDAFHRRVAAAMRHPATFAAPAMDGLLAEYATATAAVTMRYHGGVAATLAGVPSVLLSYALKTDALAEELGTGAVRLGLAPAELVALPDAVARVRPQGATVAAARERLRARQAGNVAVLRVLREAAAPRRERRA